MTPQEFVEAIKVQTSDAAVIGTITSLKHPPGGKPYDKDVRLAEWYGKLTEGDRSMLHEALKEAAELAVFSFLCVLDGVSVIEDTPEKGDLKLYFTKAQEIILLNDSRLEELHNLFNALCQKQIQTPSEHPKVRPYDSGEAKDLKADLTHRDCIDIHHVPDKHSSVRNIQGYDPERAPVIALPKSEHRKISPSIKS